MFGNVVEGVESHLFEDVLARAKRERGVRNDVDLDEDALRGVVRDFKRVYAEGAGHPFPQDPREQLRLAISRGLPHWDSPRAKVYRRASDISDCARHRRQHLPDGVRQPRRHSGTGVCFSRDPSTGERVLYGEFLRNAQGEDVVAGIRTPEPIARMAERAAARPTTSSSRRSSGSSSTTATCRTSSSRSSAARSTCCRRARASAPPRPRSRSRATSVGEGVIDREEALRRVDPSQLDQLLHPAIDPERRVRAAGPRPERLARRGRRAPSSSTPTPPSERGLAGEAVILVRWETDARRHPRRAAGPGRGDRARRHDVARRGRRARHGQAVRGRRRGAEDRRRERRRSPIGDTVVARGRRDHHRRRHRAR